MGVAPTTPIEVGRHVLCLCVYNNYCQSPTRGVRHTDHAQNAAHTHASSHTGTQSTWDHAVMVLAGAAINWTVQHTLQEAECLEVATPNTGSIGTTHSHPARPPPRPLSPPTHLRLSAAAARRRAAPRPPRPARQARRR